MGGGQGRQFRRAARCRRPVEIARRYDEQGADEITFLDITATSDGRDLILHHRGGGVAGVHSADRGGGVRTVEDVRRLLNAGADKVSMNSSAVANPQLVSDATGKYGSQCIVVAIDAKRVPRPANRRAGCSPRRPQGHRPGCGGVGREMARCGAGEILLTSMDRDGTKSGFDLELTRAQRRGAACP
jgi:cyclase